MGARRAGVPGARHAVQVVPRPAGAAGWLALVLVGGCLALCAHAGAQPDSADELDYPLESAGELAELGARQPVPSNSGAQPAAHYRWPFVSLVSFMFIGATGNILVCMAVWRERRLQTATNYFLLSLAVADLLVCTLVMPFGIINEFYGKLSRLWALLIWRSLEPK